MNDLTLEMIKKRKCLICGDIHKSISNVMCGQNHIATVVVCCNCGLTLTFSHNASEYAKYLETNECDYTTEICPDLNKSSCLNKSRCPKVLKGRKI